MNKSPEWLELSGLPELLNTKSRMGTWSVFKKIVELDCAKNSIPGIVEISASELSEMVGIICTIHQSPTLQP